MPRLALVSFVSTLLLLSGHAQATSLSAPLIPGNTTDIVWVAATNGAGVVSGLGTSDVTLDGSPNTLTLAVVQTVSTSVTFNASFGALAWDLDLLDELNGPGPLSVGSAPGFPFLEFTAGYDDPLIAPPTQDSTLGGLSGYALGIESAQAGTPFTPGPTGLTFTSFTVTFTVNGGKLGNDGNDVLWGAFGTGNAIGTDGGSFIYCNTSSSLCPTGSSDLWAGASVNIVPEPATFALITLGMGALTLAGRSRRRHGDAAVNRCASRALRSARRSPPDR